MAAVSTSSCSISNSDAAFNRVDALHHAVRAAIDDSRALLSGQPPPAQQLGELARRLREERRSASNALLASRAVRERHYFKVVAVLRAPNGCRDPPTYVSIFDGTTRFELGERIERTPCHGRRGAFFVFQTLADASRALRSSFPTSSKLLNAPRAVLRVCCDGDDAPPRVAHGKAMLWSLTPLAEVVRTAAPPPSSRESPRWQI
tara:strand:- start:714 stop:1325 length:612 start_codon:yes stop_codon:yes gene_type:complete